MGTKCDCKRDWLWVRFPLDEIKYLFKFILPISFLKFRHSTCNVSRIRRKVGNGVFNTRFLLPPLLCAIYNVKLIYFHKKNDFDNITNRKIQIDYFTFPNVDNVD